MSSRRRLIVLAVAAAAIFAGGIAYTSRVRGPSPGPLQPTDLVQSFGTYAQDGSTLSLIIELRSDANAAARLDAVSLANADGGLILVGTGILTGPFEAYVVKSYPPGPMGPVAGTEITATPGDPSGDVFIVLGIKTDLRNGRQSARGVWLDYSVAGTPHRALLPWLLSVCPEPGTDPCPNQSPASFEMPTPDP
jgi:hypothetical protein